MSPNAALIKTEVCERTDALSVGIDDSRLTLRFLLTFDDGPHSNTGKVLRQLARNPIQPGIKAIFFVQTRHPERGGSSEGRAMLTIEHAEGHLLGLHTGTSRGHVRHTSMTTNDLDRSLLDGKEDLHRITGQAPLLVRPPCWRFNAFTLKRYGQYHLHMMLSDVKAFDGVNWGVHVLRRWNFRSQLASLQSRFLRGELPVVDGSIPIVVTFHDTNRFTADHLEDYLTLLVDEAAALGLPIDTQPFFCNADKLLEAGLGRAMPQVMTSHPTATMLETH